MPPLADYLSFIFHFQAILTGPLSFYTDYMKFVSGENLKPVNGHTVSSPVFSVSQPTPWRAVAKKSVEVAIYLALILRFSSTYYPEYIAESAQLAWPLPQWLALYFFVIFLQRINYYFAWTLGLASVSQGTPTFS